MTANESLNLSLQIKDLLKQDLFNFFHTDIPVDLIEEQAHMLNPNIRERILVLRTKYEYLLPAMLF